MNYLVRAADFPRPSAAQVFVDVWDVAAPTVTVGEKSAETNGERYIACGGSGGEQALLIYCMSIFMRGEA
jgi:hypothetical protein